MSVHHMQSSPSNVKIARNFALPLISPQTGHALNPRAVAPNPHLKNDILETLQCNKIDTAPQYDPPSAAPPFKRGFSMQRHIALLLTSAALVALPTVAWAQEPAA